MKAIILAGGLGTRLRPLTNETPKPLLKIKGCPILEWAILNFKKHNITDIILSVGYKAGEIQKYFGSGEKLGVNIKYVIEDEPLGTGGAIKKAAQNIDETFLAINGDNLADFNWTEILDFHKNKKAEISLFLYPVEDVSQFGIAKLDEDKILEFVEKPKPANAPSNLNNAGGYVIEKSVLDILPEGKSSIEKDCFEILAPQGKLFGFRHSGQWFPTDDLNRYNLANENFKD